MKNNKAEGNILCCECYHWSFEWALVKTSVNNFFKYLNIKIRYRSILIFENGSPIEIIFNFDRADDICDFIYLPGIIINRKIMMGF